MTRFAVVDVETTGFSRKDRIVEIGVVLLDGDTLDVVDEYDTLVNPMRDVGATHVHGITASMVEAAPTFDEIVPSLSAVLNGAVLVAHNLPFDARMLGQDYARTGVAFFPGRGLDTLTLAGEPLDAVCARYQISRPHAHWALADARAIAALLQQLEPEFDGDACAARPPNGGLRRTFSRMSLDGFETVSTDLRLGAVRLPATRSNDLAYLDVLDRFLSDRVLDDEERDSLAELASALGINEHEQRYLHLDYIQAHIYAALRDDVVTASEHEFLTDLASTLGLDPSSLPPITEVVKPTAVDGQRVCFTGAVEVNGVPLERRHLEAIAAQVGLQPVSTVSKKGCDLLVAADVSTNSGKAKRARDWGIPVMSVADFLALTASSGVKVVVT